MFNIDGESVSRVDVPVLVFSLSSRSTNLQKKVFLTVASTSDDVEQGTQTEMDEYFRGLFQDTLQSENKKSNRECHQVLRLMTRVNDRVEDLETEDLLFFWEHTGSSQISLDLTTIYSLRLVFLYNT